MRQAKAWVLVAAVAMAAGCGVDPEDRSQANYWEGVFYDQQHPGEVPELGKADGSEYETPVDLPELVAPEVVVSLEALTVHLFDRATGFSEVYPCGVGVLGSSGRSITPTGTFATGPDTDDSWYYMPRRWYPAYFDGLPFLRLTILNSRGQHTYGMHGPITDELIRGYVSHGCIRMAADDIVRLFYLVRDHASTPVTIQQDVELDALGHEVRVGFEAALCNPLDEDCGPADDDPAGDEPGDDPPTCEDDWLESGDPAVLEAGSYQGLVLCGDDPEDWYAVELQEGQSLTVTLEFDHRVSDLDLELSCPEGASVDRSAGIGDQESVSYSAEAGALCLVRVYRYGDGETSRYALNILK